MHVPLSAQDFDKENEHIMETAEKNGYRREIIENLIKKRRKRRRRNQLTTLHQQEQAATHRNRRTAITHDRRLTKKITKGFKGQGIDVVATSRIFQKSKAAFHIATRGASSRLKCWSGQGLGNTSVRQKS